MILNKYIEENINLSFFSGIITSIKRKISKENIVFVVLALLLSNATFVTNLHPFMYVLFAVASLFDVPLLIVLLSSLLSMYIGNMPSIEIIKGIIFFVLFTLITSLLNIEGTSRKNSVFIKFILSFTIVQVTFAFFKSELLLTFFGILGNILIVSTLYYIFSSGVKVILNGGSKYITTKEETVSMIIVIAMALTIFSGLKIYNLSIANVLIMVLILIFGWKTSSIEACAAGIITGLFTVCINNTAIDFVIALAIGGLIAGIFKRFGKITIVIAFILGNIYIFYFTNNLSNIAVLFLEMLVASVSLMLMPKKVEVKLDDLFNESRTLEKPYQNMLDTATSMREKIGAISNVFETLSEIKIAETTEDKEETRNVIKKYIINYINDNIGIENEFDINDTEKIDLTVDHLADKLEKNEEITENMLMININNPEKLVKDIKEVYGSMKLMRIIKLKEQENSKKLSSQYKEISNLLNIISENMKKEIRKQDKLQQVIRDELKMYGYVIYEDELKKENNDIEYVFVTDILTNIEKQKKQIISLISNVLERNVNIKLILNSSKKEKSKIKIVTIPEYEVKTAIVSEKKNDSDVSGDSYLSMELPDLKQVCILSDGAGSGKNASKGSQTVINLIEKLLDSGFDEESSIKIINSFLKLKGNDEIYSTLDTFIVNLKNARAQFIKLGAAPTYILKDGRVSTISNINIPLGLVNNTDYVPIVNNLDDRSIVVQLTDGVISENDDYNHNFLTNYLKMVDTEKSAKVISEEIRKLVLKEKNNILDDDFTVIVSKISKTNE